MDLKVQELDHLPSAVRRGGADSEEARQLEEWVASQNPYLIEGIPDDEYTRLQQRIRAAANRVGLAVKVHRQPGDKVAFQGYEKDDTPTKADQQRQAAKAAKDSE